MDIINGCLKNNKNKHMNIRYFIYIFLVTFFLCLKGFSQESKLEKANREYEKLGFIKASEIYEDVAKKGYSSPELFIKLANTYYFNAKYEDAVKWYGELFKVEKNILPVYYMRYSQCLKAIGEDEKAKEVYNKYVEQLENKDEKVFSASDYLNIIENNSGRYQITALPINTNGIDFGGTYHDGELMFSSTRDTGSIIKRTSAWDGLTFLDLYKVEVDSAGNYGKVRELKGDVNTKFHESTACITPDGRTIYFTRNNMTPEMSKDRKAIQRLKIYSATFVNGKWTNVKDLSINGDNYSTAHPVLNSTGDKLYFVSDRPESLGATDIFMADIHSDGSLGRVENLGNKINTLGRESFPFISDRNELYFSSDGHFGLGGYDVFYTQLNKKGHGSLINVGKPINSELDDVTFAINTVTHKGFISSNRPGGEGYDDIYSFIETKDIRALIKSRIYGKVTDKSTGNPLSGSTITLYDEDGNVAAVVATNAEGDYSVETDRFIAYRVRATKEKYSADEGYASIGKEEQEINFALDMDEYDLFDGDDLAKILGIKEIHFDFDKAIIRPDAEVELQKILTVMNKYPQLHIDIRSFTDSRGNDNYNEILSDKRAKSTMGYLIKKGIPSSNLSAKGYGERNLLNKCSNGVKCTEEQHQQNRRSEFIISKKK